MANFYDVSIRLADIDRIQLYINSPAKTLAQIKASTGADYLINGGLYKTTTWKPDVHTKSDGVVYGKSAWNGLGLAWGTNDPCVTWLPADYQNYLEGNILVQNGKPVEKLNYDSAQGGKRGRTAIGIKNGCLCLYCSRDGSTAARTPETLRDALAALGWSDAIMLDSGGSSQCDFLGDKITSTRKVQNLVLVYLRRSGSQTPTVCPYAEPTSTVRLGSRGTGAKWVQWQLNRFGYGLAVDGIFGAKSVAALKAFQSTHSLAADGICGKLTRAKLKEG